MFDKKYFFLKLKIIIYIVKIRNEIKKKLKIIYILKVINKNLIKKKFKKISNKLFIY